MAEGSGSENGKFGLIGVIMGAIKGAFIAVSNALPTFEAIVQTIVLSSIGAVVSIGIGVVYKKYFKKDK